MNWARRGISSVVIVAAAALVVYCCSTKEKAISRYTLLDPWSGSFGIPLVFHFRSSAPNLLMIGGVPPDKKTGSSSVQGFGFLSVQLVDLSRNGRSWTTFLGLEDCYHRRWAGGRIFCKVGLKTYPGRPNGLGRSNVSTFAYRLERLIHHLAQIPAGRENIRHHRHLRATRWRRRNLESLRTDTVAEDPCPPTRPVLRLARQPGGRRDLGV